MDKELKARKMASASVRKQRIQERQRQQDLMREQRKNTMPRPSEAYSSDSSDTSDSSRSNSPGNDSSAETPSEYSLKTPENSFSPDVEIQTQPADVIALGDPKREQDATLISKPTILERRRSRSVSKQIMFSSSLNRPCDFRYDRFSTVIDPIEIPQVVEREEQMDGSSSSAEDEQEEADEDEDDYSPIELATPVAIRMPISRPSVVSVVGGAGPQPSLHPGPQPGPQKFSVKNINTIMITPPKPPAPRPRTIEITPILKPQTQNGHGFPINEPKAVETITPLSSCINVSVEPTSAKSLPAPASSTNDSSLRKKSSMPMLTKFTHARMNSIKNLIKPQSISGPPPAVPLIPSAHQPRPSESMSNILLSASTHRNKPSVADKVLPPSPRRSLTEPPWLQPTSQEKRPQTARSQSQNAVNTLANCSQGNIAILSSRSQISITALPTPTSSPSRKASTKAGGEESEGPAMNRKKSFSNLRRRSGSIGQALKFGSSSKSKPSTPDAPPPPVPMIRVPTQESVQTLNYPPLPKTPKTVRKSGMMYSPFPPPSQKGEPVGLGLRM